MTERRAKAEPEIYTPELLIAASPIAGLFGQIEVAFETAGPGALSRIDDAMRAGALSPQLSLDNRARLSVFARIEQTGSEPARIILGLAFLEALWAFCYAYFVRYEWEMQCRLQIMGKAVPEAPIESTVLDRAIDLGAWAGTLPWGYSAWPANVPSPRAPAPGQETIYASKVNTLFLQSTAFLLWHEVGHWANGDLTRTRGDDAAAVAEEIRADSYAYAVLIAADPSELGRRRAGWAVLLPMLTLLNLARAPADLFPERHPVTHERLAQQLQRLDFQERENQDYFDGLAMLLLHLFVDDHALRPADAPRSFETAQEGLAYYLALLERTRPVASPPPP